MVNSTAVAVKRLPRGVRWSIVDNVRLIEAREG